MAIGSPLQTNSAVGQVAGSPKSVTAGLTSLSGSDVMIVVCVSGRSVLQNTFNFAATWDGTPMTSAIIQNAGLNGFGRGRAEIFYLAIGTVAGLTANAVATVTGGDSTVGIMLTVMAYTNVDQADPLNFTDNAAVISGSGAVTLDVIANDSSDRVIGCVTFAERVAGGDANPTSGQTKITGIDNNSPGTGDPCAHVVGEDLASSSNQAGNWDGFGSSWSAVIASFNAGAGAAGPAISDVNGGAYASPDETNLDVNGSDMNPGGNPTELQYADGPVFATAAKQIQAISGITATTLNWDTINVGSIGEGDNFLFVVTDPGGGGESVSPAFPILVATSDVFAIRVIHVTDGTLGPVLVAPTEFSTAKAAILRATGNTLVDTLQPDAVLTLCFVDANGGKGLGIGSTNGPDTHQREQIEGTGSFFLHDGGAGPHLLEGTPTLTSQGLEIDFTINTAGHNIQIVVIGGDSVLASVDKLNINSSPKTGLGFRPDVLLSGTVGILGTSTGDSTFALMSYGICIDTGTPAQWNLATDQSGSTRNSLLTDGSMLGQLQGTAFTWEMEITSIDADGYTWNGTNTDSANILALRLPGKQLFVDTFAKADVAPGGTQQLPDLGFDPGSMSIVTSARIGQNPATALGARFSNGFVTSDGQDVVMAQCLQATGTMTAEHLQSFTNCVAISSQSGTITILGKIIDFAQVSTIEWTNSPPGSTVQIGLFAIEEFEADDIGDTVTEFLF